MSVKKNIEEKVKNVKSAISGIFSGKNKNIDFKTISTTYGTYLSSDKETSIEYLYIAPNGEPKLVLQFMHGMAEHKERYIELGEYLANEGIAFFINDHLGHGNSIKSPKHLGYFDTPEGWNRLLDDAKSLSDIATATFPEVPFVIGGHSMGSFLARIYVATYPNVPDKAVFVGTGDGGALAYGGVLLAKLVGVFKSGFNRSDFLDNMAFGTYNKKIPNAQSSFAWLSVNEDNVKTYEEDPLCGYRFTTNGFQNLFTLVAKASKLSTMQKYDRNMPVLLMAGEEDPVGHYGKDLLNLSKKLSNIGIKNVNLNLYPNLRHEIFNEDNRKEIFADLVNWLLEDHPRL